MPTALASFLAALSFLTRMGRPQVVDDDVLARSVRWYGAVGAVVGAASTLPAWALTQGLGPAFGTAGGASGLWVAAWLYVLLGTWITRGMHWDGLADVGDACGSGAQGEDFWKILHDSRLGAFGGMSLCLGLLGMCVAAQGRMALHMWLALALAPAFGRCCAVMLASLVSPKSPSSLGGKACAGARPPVAVGHAVLALATASALPLWDAVGTLAAAAGGIYFLLRLARRQGGVNGDMLGAAIVCGELVYLMKF